jgi:hypothetical protein
MRYLLAIGLLFVATTASAQTTVYHYGSYGQPRGSSVYYHGGSQMRLGPGAVSLRGWQPRYINRHRAPVYWGGWAIGGAGW